MRVIFMGTPDFAVASLRRLVEDGLRRAVLTGPFGPGRRYMRGFYPAG